MLPRVLPFLTLALALWLSLPSPSPAGENQHTVRQVLDLAALGAEARSSRRAILLMFSQDDCPYCAIMEANYLRPMLMSGEYDDKVIIRKVKIDDFETLIDFDGRRIEPDHLTGRYRAWVTPTLVFLNSDGEEMAPKLVGIGTEGFFAGEIDQAINVALTRVRSVALK